MELIFYYVQRKHYLASILYCSIYFHVKNFALEKYRLLIEYKAFYNKDNILDYQQIDEFFPVINC